MKKTIRKILIIFCAVFFAVFSTVAFPIQQAQAFPLGAAVPGGITIGAGGYALGALGLAGLVGMVGYEEHSDAINAHAKGVWEGGTQTAKDSLNWSIEQARGAGNGLVTLQTDFQQFVDGNLTNIALSSVEIASLAGVPDGTGFTFNKGYESISYMSGRADFGFLVENIRTGELIESSALGVTLLSGNRLSLTGGVVTVTAEQYSEVRNLLENATGYGSITSIIGTYAPQMAYAMGNVGDLRLGYQKSYGKVQEAWEGMKDAGLVLPVDSAVPLSSIDGSPLTYNPTADSYTGIDGGVYSGTPAWAFPQPKIRTGTADIPAGVYVDTPVLTGNPTYDKTITDNPAIPKTTTNVQTGVTVGNPDYATDTPINPPVTVPGTIPPVVPPFDAPGSTGLDFTPLMMTGTAMTNKFPFSIPFDFVKQLQILNVEPQAPSFDINVPEFLKVGGFTIPFKFKLSFEMFDPVANLIRWGLIIIFDISLIFAIRKLLPE